MNAHISGALAKFGQTPGALQYIGECDTEKITLSLISYTKTDYREENDMPFDAEKLKDLDSGIYWITLNGIHDVDVMKRIGETFRIDDLDLEDLMNTLQRPRIEDKEDYVFMVFKLFRYDVETQSFMMNQIGMCLIDNKVILWTEKKLDIIQPVVRRIQRLNSRFRARGADYLFYAIIDCIVDHYFIVLEQVADQVERLEDQILESPTQETLESVYRVKRSLVSFRKNVFPMREMVYSLLENESEFIKEETEPFLRDLHDHVLRVIDNFEALHEVLTNMIELHLSNMSNKLNDVMKFLAIISTLFIPMTFIAGIYGMNFESMPELRWEWGYPMAIGIMVLMGGGMFYYFKKKRWV